MPGKINPVIPELAAMVSFQVVGYDVAVAMAVQAGQLELNVMMPTMAYSVLQSITILTDEAHWPADIDRDRAEEAKAHLERTMQEQTDDKALLAAQVLLKRELLKLDIHAFPGDVDFDEES